MEYRPWYTEKVIGYLSEKIRLDMLIFPMTYFERMTTENNDYFTVRFIIPEGFSAPSDFLDAVTNRIDEFPESEVSYRIYETEYYGTPIVVNFWIPREGVLDMEEYKNEL